MVHSKSRLVGGLLPSVTNGLLFSKSKMQNAEVRCSVFFRDLCECLNTASRSLTMYSKAKMFFCYDLFFHLRLYRIRGVWGRTTLLLDGLNKTSGLWTISEFFCIDQEFRSVWLSGTCTLTALASYFYWRFVKVTLTSLSLRFTCKTSALNLGIPVGTSYW